VISARAAWRLLRDGNLRGRVRATREGRAAIRLQLGTAALECGVLDILAAQPARTVDLARRTGAPDAALLGSFLRVLAAAGLVEGDGRDEGAVWQLTRRGRAVATDDLVRASYEAFGGFHTDLYRELRPLVRGGPPRRDVVERGALIARISAAFEPFVQDILVRTVTERRPRRVLDIGCGAGLQLATMLEAAPSARGVGVEADAAAAVLAERTLGRRGLAVRSTVLRTDLRQAVADGHGALDTPFDLALMANVIHYVPVSERVALLRTVAGLLCPGGVLLIVTTAATPQLVSRHFDLLLRAQEGQMQLPVPEVLVRQVSDAGFQPGTLRRIVPGTPLVALAARTPDPGDRRGGGATRARSLHPRPGGVHSGLRMS
jgi:SAM-dependent methyltransferase